MANVSSERGVKGRRGKPWKQPGGNILLYSIVPFQQREAVGQGRRYEHRVAILLVMGILFINLCWYHW